ncbi:MAG TPA: rhomboid family intramembrane serine protease [Candidatus Limnocylindrales bacterium]|nr:rhomboid family intramembrane serine protease [Candidatus Limnocylindrales bacterium]
MFPIGDQNEPGGRRAPVTLVVILINIAVFLLLQLPEADRERQPFTYGYSVVPYEITHEVDLVRPTQITIGGETGVIDQEPGPRPIWLTLFTSMFMHGGWLHILGNMWFLWIFGDNIERRFGSIPYAVFYLAAGVIASFAQIAAGPESRIPSLGASGAIAGVLGAYIALFPTNRVTIVAFRFIPFVVPAFIALGIWFLLQFVNGFASIAVTEQTGGVAYLAHVGGFVSGVVVGLFARSAGPRRPAYRF